MKQAPISGPSIPEAAIGRPGMVAMLRRLGDEADGRLVVVREPVGFLTTMVRSPRPVFCWLARLLGRQATIHGQIARDIHVPDACLFPMGALSNEELAALIRTQGAADFTAALIDLRDTLGATDLPVDEFERFADRAAQQIGIERALEVIATPKALREIGFVPERVDGDALIWAGVHAGTELRFHAGANLYMGWTLVATANARREAIWDEQQLPLEAPRGQIVARVLHMWQAAFPGAPVPDALRLGDVHQRHQRLLRGIAPGLPTLHPHPVAFRAIRKWLIGPDGAAHSGLVDLWVRLSHDDAMLRIEIDGAPYGCPAGGTWVEAREVRLQDLAAVPTEVLRRQSLTLVQMEDCILINDWRLPSRQVKA